MKKDTIHSKSEILKDTNFKYILELPQVVQISTREMFIHTENSATIYI